MVARSVGEAASAMGGGVVAADASAVVWNGAALDSRKIQGGELFFALRGEQADGHHFVADALARGAAAAVVERALEAPAGAPLVQVDDAFAGLHALSRAVRAQVPRRLVGITGSAGKTTTKELLAAMLASRFRVARSPGNLNNLYGFPLALLGIPDDTEWMVAELGMSTPGELRQVSLLARPDVVVFTNVRPAHLEFFGTVAAIAEAKAEILTGLDPQGLVVVNADDPEVRRISARWPGRRVTYGLAATAADADVRADEIEISPGGRVGSRFRLTAGKDQATVSLPLLGAHNIENCLAAAAAAWSLGVPLDVIALAVAAIAPAAMRGVVHALTGGGTLVDDSYNANPAAVEHALRAAATLPAMRRWAVLGDMRELGPRAPEFHRVAGALAAELGFAPIFAVGPLARDLAAGAGTAARWFADAAEAAAAAPAQWQPGDLVLVKGSRGVGLEVVVRALLGRSGEPEREA